MIKRITPQVLIALLLTAVLVITRAHLVTTHFGDRFTLPDASWAVFWIMGLLVRHWAWPVLLMVLSGVIDTLVIANGVSDYCFTPAYIALLPAYGALWLGGRLLSQHTPQWRSLPWLVLSLIGSVSACFVISNIGFYLGAGYFTNMSILRYAQAVARYFPYFLQTTAAYASIAVVLWAALHSLAVQRAARI